MGCLRFLPLDTPNFKGELWMLSKSNRNFSIGLWIERVLKYSERGGGGGEDGGGEKFGRGRGWGKLGNRFALCKGKKRAEWNIIIFSLFSISWGIF